MSRTPRKMCWNTAADTKCGSAIVPFMDNFPKHTQLYQWMTTKPSDLTV